MPLTFCAALAVPLWSLVTNELLTCIVKDIHNLSSLKHLLVHAMPTHKKAFEDLKLRDF